MLKTVLAILLFVLSNTLTAQPPVISSFSPSAATRFDTVTISGFHFSSVTSVHFGDSLAFAFQVVSDSVIKAVVSNGADGFVYVSDGSITDTSDSPFFYQAYQPKILSFTPATGTDQTIVTITGRQLIGTSSIRFGNRPADSFAVVSNTKIIAVVGVGNTGAVSITNNNIRDSLVGFNYYVTPPAITSFTPASGPIGTQVTISGIGFSPIAANNTVYFGKVKATVINASRTSLTAVVPSGADYQPISVTYNNYTGYSRQPFLVTFPGATSSFSATSFDSQFKISTIGSNPSKLASADFDGDGRVDIAVAYGFFGTTNTTVSVYRNISNGNNILFASPTEYAAGTQGYSGFDVATADIDGDGKIDLIALSTGNNIAGVFRNTSTAGSISFAPRADIVTGSASGAEGTSPNSMAIADLDGDGKPDFAFANFGLDNWCKVTFIRNTSTNGTISFASRIDYSMVDAYLVSAGHLNSDAKPDLAVGIYVNGSFMQEVTPMLNISTPGNISLYSNTSVGPSNTLRPTKIVFGDIDADGKQDMIVGNNSYTFSVYKNTSVDSGYITFATPVNITAGANSSTVKSVTVSDADGDGKLDVVVALTNDSKTILFKNTSTASTISFATPVLFACGQNPEEVMCSDLNGDGKPDMVVANSGESSVSILANNVGGPLKLCPPAASFSLNANISGTNYQWQVDSGNHVFTDIPNNNLYSGATTASLQVTNIPSSYSGYQYRCSINGTYTYPVKIQFENRWLGNANSLWRTAANWSCGIIPDANTDVIIRSGYVIVNSNAICRSVTVLPGASLTVYPGNSLTITH